MIRISGATSNASLIFAWSCVVWVCVVEPRMNQFWSFGFWSNTAPVTGVPAPPATPADSSRFANETGCASLSSRFTSTHHANGPSRLPIAALPSPPP